MKNKKIKIDMVKKLCYFYLGTFKLVLRGWEGGK